MGLCLQGHAAANRNQRDQQVKLGELCLTCPKHPTSPKPGPVLFLVTRKNWEVKERESAEFATETLLGKWEKEQEEVLFSSKTGEGEC